MDILYQNKDYVIIIKPVGIESEQDCPALLTQQLGGTFFPLHRLDKNVSGVMVYARNKETAATLSRCIQDGKMIKEYVAWVHGQPEPEGEWTDLLYKDPRKNKVFVVNRKRNGVKEARLSYQVLKTEEEKSLVQVRLFTGRTHQIRVQFSSRGLPLVGERKYAVLNDPCEIALWSHKIAFTHPGTGEWTEFSKEPPAVYPWTDF